MSKELRKESISYQCYICPNCSDDHRHELDGVRCLKGQLETLKYKTNKLQKKIDTLVSDVADHVNDKLELKENLENAEVRFSKKYLEVRKLKAEVKRLEGIVKEAISLPKGVEPHSYSDYNNEKLKSSNFGFNCLDHNIKGINFRCKEYCGKCLDTRTT